MDWLDDAVQPRCPQDGTLLVVADGAYRCRDCGHAETTGDAVRPADGAGIVDLR